MPIPTPFRHSAFVPVRCLVLLTLTLTLEPAAFAIGDEIAVAGRAFNGYSRTRLPDKSYQPETFTFGDGGRYDAPVAGDPIDDLKFVDIARQLIGPLANQGYVQSADPANTKLLILVMWGSTIGTEESGVSPAYQRVQETMASLNSAMAGARADLRAGPAAAAMAGAGILRQAEGELSSGMTSLILEQNLRDKLDTRNAEILGFQTELWRADTTFGTTSAADFFSELRSSRYFVVLKAYDFQVAWKEKRRKILWEARFSIRARGVDFAEQLPAMATFASTYFGKQLDNLVRRPLPEVKIEYGEPTFMGYEGRK